MDHASIVSFLQGTCSPEDFGVEVAPEVAACLQDCRTGGPCTPVVRDHAIRLLRALLDERLSFDTASYLADGLIMSDDFGFADASVADAIAFVADYSRHSTADEARTALTRLA